ncbi:MAG TPA: DUF4302 domain-containing protein [Parasegetibacter sp.]
MLKNILYIAMTATLLVSCRKDNDPIFEDPDKRLIAQLGEYREMLISAENGWNAILFPNGGEGFMYHIQFKPDNGVVMFSDFDENTASTSGGGTWRLKALQRPTLIFDTYSYLHLPADPDGDISGGTTGVGLQSDFEFYFAEVKNDSVKMKGLYNGSTMTLVKATKEESDKIKAGALKTMMEENDNFLKNNENLYISFSDGKKLQFSMAGKTLSLTWVTNTDEVESISSAFAFTLKGITLKEPLVYGNNVIKEFLWDDVQKRYYVMVNNTRYDVLNSPVPIIPVYFRFGPGKEFTNITVNVPTLTGLPPAFMDVYNAAVAGLNALSGRTFNYFIITFTSPTEMTMRLNYRNTAGTVFNADFNYSVTWTGSDVVDFTFVSRNNNANTAGPGIVALTNYLENNQFKIDWASNLTPGSTALLAGFYRLNATNDYFFGVLGK